MTLRRITRPDGTERVQWQSCPYCGGSIGPQESFRQHWRQCPGNSRNSEECD